MATTPDSTLVNQLLIADLRRQLAECRAERDEALQRETATAEVLQVINSSPGDLTSVFDAMLDRAMRLCGADYGGLGTWRSGRFVWDNTRGLPPALAEYLRANDVSVGSPIGFARVARGAGYIHTLDLAASPHYLRGHPFTRAIADLGGARTTLTIPFAKDDTVLGVLGFFRQEVKPFSDRQITLLQSFATQAVIAVENARLLTETREALEQQIAAAEVMQAINASPGNLVPVFEAMLDKAMRLCEASFGTLWVYDGARMQPMATRGSSPQYIEFLRQGPHRPSPVQRRLIAGENVIEVVDVAAGEGYRYGDPLARALVDLGNIRSLVAVALRKEGTFLGAITIYREERRSFADKEITLLQNFAQQAVIAMENARLLTETREALEQQTATAEVLQVINSSPGDLAPVFDAILEKAHTLCGAAFGALWTYDGEHFDAVALWRVPPRLAEFLWRRPVLTAPGGVHSRLLRGEQVVKIDDVAAQPSIKPARRALVEDGGARTVIAVPLRNDDRILGAITAYRQEVRPFSDKQIALLQNFAAQAVIAMENARLIGELRQARDAAENALNELKTAQASLIQAEKMASLGQLTAGIAHEIKNPLNFVNNFAGLSVELLDELKNMAEPGFAALDTDTRDDITETMDMLTGNLDKIAEHGRRADGIVQSMLLHSRGSSGERRKVDLNEVVDEALNLAYHGARARDPDFNITLERDFAATLPPVELVPQDMMRVFINLIVNGFYAANKRLSESDTAYFTPLLKVATRDLGDQIEVRVRDNGVGIPAEIQSKLFQPFFTTKPSGEGTGLGLSISYDIVTQQHGGTISVESEPGAFTEFTVRLPRH